MGRIEYIEGEIIEGLEFTVEVEGKITKDKKLRQGVFKCTCGNLFTATFKSIKSKNTKSCGCLWLAARKAQKKHDFINTPIYKVWANMKTRCYNPNSKDYVNYNSHNISVCEEWKNSFLAFYRDVKDLPNYGIKGYSLDRINNDGNYEPSNVRWADKYTQANNKKFRNGLTNEDIIEIRKLHKSGLFTQRKIATDFNIGYATMSNIVNNKIYDTQVVR